jgi:hypothetical protein
MLAEEEEGDDDEEDARKFRLFLLFFSFRQDSHGIRRLELALVAAGDDDIVDLEHHPAQLGGEQELLALGDERVDDEGGFHVCSRAGQCMLRIIVLTITRGKLTI